LIEQNSKPIYTLGPIIHNEQVVNRLKSKGVREIKDIRDTDGDGIVVIRAHGVGHDVYEDIRKSRLEVVDATCPYVKKIQELVQKKYNEGYRIVIIGNK